MNKEQKTVLKNLFNKLKEEDKAEACKIIVKNIKEDGDVYIKYRTKEVFFMDLAPTGIVDKSDPVKFEDLNNWFDTLLSVEDDIDYEKLKEVLIKITFTVRLKNEISEYIFDTILDSQVNLIQEIKHKFKDYDPNWSSESTSVEESTALNNYVSEIVNNLFAYYK